MVGYPKGLFEKGYVYLVLPQIAHSRLHHRIENDVTSSNNSLFGLSAVDALACLVQSHHTTRATSIDNETDTFEVEEVRHAICEDRRSIAGNLILGSKVGISIQNSIIVLVEGSDKHTRVTAG